MTVDRHADVLILLASTGMKDEVIRAQLKHQCRHSIPTVAGKEMMITTSSRPIKSPGALPRNPNSSRPSPIPSVSIILSSSCTPCKTSPEFLKTAVDGDHPELHQGVEEEHLIF
jgi:hypothetical protein